MLGKKYDSIRALTVLGLISIVMGGCQRGKQTPAPSPKGVAPPSDGKSSLDAATNLALGNPSNATNDARNADNYLLEKPQYVMSYNSSNGGPNWASWHVQESDLGRVPRSNDFAPDPALPAEWQIRPNDYTGSGYDRGHVCPSGDRTASRRDNDATFTMSNMLPQEGDLNRHVWEGLESYCRTLVRDGNEVYIVAGGYGSKGRIGRGKVNVPTNCWKVVVVLPAGDNDLARIDSGTRVIAVDMPNESGISNDNWHKYVTTVSNIEKMTRYRFFTNVPAAVQDVIKNQMDAGQVKSGRSSSSVEKSRKRSRNSQRRRRKRREE